MALGYDILAVCLKSIEVFLVAYTRFNVNLEIFAETRPNRQQHSRY
jgi:hypothetical protein